jgi:triosephosphate isomerase
MYTSTELKAPVFEIGFKAYLFGEEALKVAKAADQISVDTGIPIILSPQYVDIARIASETEKLLVFAQHCNSLEIGRGVGSILPEAIKAAGAAGVMLNHAERRMTLSEIARTIKRADEVGLMTMVCGDTPEEAMAVAQFHPNIILAEPPALIGSGAWAGVEDAEEYVSQSIGMVKKVDRRIIVLSGAGIKNGDDVRQIVRTGADGTGACTAIVKADDPEGMIEEMVTALKEAWREADR